MGPLAESGKMTPYSKTSILRLIICITLIITVAPFCALFTLVCVGSTKCSDITSLRDMLMMSFFGLFTPPVWIALVITPITMHVVAEQPWFIKLESWKLVILAIISGALGGVITNTPILLEALDGPFEVAKMWLVASAVSGAITLTAIAFVYRIRKSGCSA